jgi:hypothetical protein
LLSLSDGSDFQHKTRSDQPTSSSTRKKPGASKRLPSRAPVLPAREVDAAEQDVVVVPLPFQILQTPEFVASVPSSCN